MSSKLLELASKPETTFRQGTNMTDGVKGRYILGHLPQNQEVSDTVDVQRQQGKLRRSQRRTPLQAKRVSISTGDR